MARLTSDDIKNLTALRHKLHQNPEVSGEEIWTADQIRDLLEEEGADRIWTGLGGYGVAAEFNGAAPGPTVLIRCELDGLPIHEVSNLSYRSKIEGKGHLCGHDGHMAMVMGVAMGLRQRLSCGRVILLFQPAEETGQGAKAVIADPRWSQLRPDYAFAYHNVPGRPQGEIGLCTGPACCASRGMQVKLKGKSSHAAAPEDGLSPAPALARLMIDFAALGTGGQMDEAFSLSTLTHVNLGVAAYGIAPGEAELRVTLRSVLDASMDDMIADARDRIASACGELEVETSFHEVFLGTVNETKAVSIARKIAIQQGLPIHEMTAPQRWSEDFGRFGLDGACAALLFIGSGENHPQLHNPDFDFPDDLIPIGAKLFLGIIDHILGA